MADKDCGGLELSACRHLEPMAKVWEELKDQKQFTDATLVCCDGVSFPVHRALLAGCSRFFRAMFSNPMNQNDENRMHLQNVSSEELSVLLRYVYSRELRISNDNVTKLLHASDYLSVLDVHQQCVNFLKDVINPNNCLSIRQFSRDHFLPELEKDAQWYLLKNFPQVAETSQEIMTLPLDELVPLLSSDYLNVRVEETVWRLVLRWIDHDRDNRMQHLVPLLKCIRLGLMEVQFFLENVVFSRGNNKLADKKLGKKGKCSSVVTLFLTSGFLILHACLLEQVKNHAYVQGNEVCRPVIIDTLKVLMDVETITQLDGVVQTPECARPRIPHEVLFAIGGWSGGSPTSAVETYDSRADRWIKVEEVDPAGPRAYHGTAVIGFEIYVIGGFDGMENFNSCRCFNTVTKVWREIAPMHERRCYVSVVVLDNIVYAMGGYNGHHRQNTAEKYDHVSNQWTTIAPMHVQRSDASATVLDGRIYITGGFDGRECLSSAEMYDPLTNVWTLLPPMRSRRSGVSCVAHHGSVYVLGGFNGVSRMSSAEKYTPITNQWTPLPDMYTTRSNFAIEVIDDLVFAIGGFNGIATIHQVECFDDRNQEWYEATDMNVFRSALSACVVADLPNINDFIHQNRHMLMEEKRQKLLALNQNNTVAPNNENNPAVMNITQALQEVNNEVNNNIANDHIDMDAQNNLLADDDVDMDE